MWTAYTYCDNEIVGGMIIMSIIKLVRIIEKNKSIGECMFCNEPAYYAVNGTNACRSHIVSTIEKVLR